MTERDPNGLDPHASGAKLDAGKVQAHLLKDFSLALTEVAKVSTFGAQKYSVGGWQYVVDGAQRYDAAAWRHMLAERHESHDPQTGLLHLAHECWNKLARLELLLREQHERSARCHVGTADPSPQQEGGATSGAGKLAEHLSTGKRRWEL